MLCVSSFPLIPSYYYPQSMQEQCRPMFAFAERIADWLMHGYYPDEICEKIKLCKPGFFDV